MELSLSRRSALRAGLALVASSALPIWVRAEAEPTPEPLLVVVFLRGGADGLHLVPPVGDPGYASLRGALALPEPLRFPESYPGGADFALHPALAALSPLAARGELAVVHAAGLPGSGRSHFAAQDQLEAGRPGSPRVDQGWLARALSNDAAQPFAHVAVGASLPISLRGSGAFAVGSPDSFGLPAASAAARAALERAWSGSDRSDAVLTAGQTALGALAEFERRLPPSVSENERRRRRDWLRSGRQQVRASLVQSAQGLAALVDAGLPVRAACIESSGWDTHRSQGLAEGSFARSARDLGEALATLAELGRRRRDWLVVVMTEFGRTVRPNGSGGSDHGHGSAVLVAGSGVRAGIHGDWPGLSTASLFEGRDLAIATDTRSILAEILRAHLRRKTSPETFPGFTPTAVGVVA